MAFTNYNDVPLTLAVWLAANDGYDLVPKPNTISATSLMKPTKSLILEQRVAKSDTDEFVVDVSDLVASRVGTAVHSAAEYSWANSREVGLKALGIPQKIIDKIRLNPEVPGDDPQFDMYMERRSNKQVGKWTISGKFDFVFNGRVQDIKTTKTYNWIKGTNDEKYRIQGSIYRWLNPDIITDDHIDVLMIFTDWSPLQAMANKEYPKKRIMVRTLPLMTIQETETWVRGRLAEIEKYADKNQSDMPQCTPKELWQDPSKWAYYKNPQAKRATKLYDTPQEANQRKVADGIPISIVVERPAIPKFCDYCAGRPICLQAQAFAAQGLLKY